MTHALLIGNEFASMLLVVAVVAEGAEPSRAVSPGEHPRPNG
jgi:hypothetical protein